MLEAFRHVVHAAHYSAAGIRYMLATQTAARIELGFAALAFLWFAILWRSFGEFVVLAILLLVLLAGEAANTALEEVVNRVSPERSAFGAHTKDLGSAVVFFLAVACGLYVLAVTLDAFGWIAL
jgi:diacylglycerol kinase (ATP)